LRKFDSKSDNEILLEYSETSNAFKVYNSRTLVVEEPIHAKFNDTKPDKKLSELDESSVDLRLDNGIIDKVSSSQNLGTVASTPPLDGTQEEIREPIRHVMRKNHSKSQIIVDPIESVQTRASLKLQGHTALISQIEPKHIDEAMQDDNWVKAMQEEPNQF